MLLLMNIFLLLLLLTARCAHLKLRDKRREGRVTFFPFTVMDHVIDKIPCVATL